jgi:hypothetical protein
MEFDIYEEHLEKLVNKEGIRIPKEIYYSHPDTDVAEDLWLEEFDSEDAYWGRESKLHLKLHKPNRDRRAFRELVMYEM